jgi:hypothetical protein
MHRTAALLSLCLPLALISITWAQESKTATRFGTYAVVPLEFDTSTLVENERQMIRLLIEAAKEMDAIFWKQAYGDREALLESIKDADLRRYAEINYGPWDRLAGDKPFIEGVNAKPLGARFYPAKMNAKQFNNYLQSHPDQAEALKSQYTVVRRNKEGLNAVPYHKAFAKHTKKAASLLDEAALLAPQASLKAYLTARAEALRTDDYQPSDLLWMDMKDNRLDVVIGPIETYEDKLFGYKAAHECYVLVKDLEWSQRLAKYASLLPELQKKLPVAEKYRSEVPGSDSDLNAYDVVYYAGDCNSGSKTIAINLPNDEQVQLQKGTRRLQLKNAMQAKFDGIMLPIADTLLVADQRKHVTFDAFFANTMFHEVAHGLGIKYTITGKGSVREALLDTSGSLEEGKADILGLFMVSQLIASGDLEDADLMDYYVTFMAGIFRSVRFGASSAHGKANMIRFNFFKEQGAFTRQEDGRYRVNPEGMERAVAALTERLLTLQGNGDYDAAKKFVEEMAVINPELQGDLDRLSQRGIPVDVVFQQGTEVLGL